MTEGMPALPVLGRVKEPSTSFAPSHADASQTCVHVVERKSAPEINLRAIISDSSWVLQVMIDVLGCDVCVVTELHAAIVSRLDVAVVMSTAARSLAKFVCRRFVYGFMTGTSST